MLLKAKWIAQAKGKDWRKELQYFLRAYHTTPHTITGMSPAEIMFGRKLRTNLPALRFTKQDKEMRDRKIERKFKIQENTNLGRCESSNINIGDKVLLRKEKENKLTTNFSTTPAHVIGGRGTQVTVETPEGVTYKRNLSHVNSS